MASADDRTTTDSRAPGALREMDPLHRWTHLPTMPPINLSDEITKATAILEDMHTLHKDTMARIDVLESQTKALRMETPQLHEVIKSHQFRLSRLEDITHLTNAGEPPTGTDTTPTSESTCGGGGSGKEIERTVSAPGLFHFPADRTVISDEQRRNFIVALENAIEWLPQDMTNTIPKLRELKAWLK